MPETSRNKAVRPKAGRARPRQVPAATYLGAAAVAAVAGFVAVYVTLMGEGNLGPGGGTERPAAGAPRAPSPAVPAAGPLAGLNTGKLAAFVVRSAPQELPDVGFVNAEGEEKSLADWRGKVVLLNLWATWCAPCREEMPSLDRLKGRIGGGDFDVVAVASERGSIDKPRAFLAEIGAGNLALYHDPSARLPATLKAFGMPATVLIDREGREIGRLVGPAEWDSPEAVALVGAALAR